MEKSPFWPTYSLTLLILNILGYLIYGIEYFFEGIRSFFPIFFNLVMFFFELIKPGKPYGFEYIDNIVYSFTAFYALNIIALAFALFVTYKYETQ